MKNKRDIKVYIAGAYTGKDDVETVRNIYKARELAVKLWDLGYAIFCPHMNSMHFENLCNTCDYDGFASAYINFLKVCDCVMLIDNWKQSKGANAEVQKALKWHIPIFESIESLEGFYNVK